jgi:hypothetical protein
MEQQVNWDTVFNAGKERFLADLTNHKIDPSLVTQYGTPLINALYGLKPYIMADSSKGEVISSNTKQYVLKTILPSLNKSIDDYWANLGYIKKQSFKLLSKNNGDRIRGAISSAFLTFINGFLWGLDSTKAKGNIWNVVDDLKDYVGYYESPFVVSAVHKIQSLT